MANEEKFRKALEELRKSEKKVNFDQTIDLIVNLKNFDIRKHAFNIFIPVPNKVKDKKIAGFLEKKSALIDTITPADFVKFKEKKEIKKLTKNYDFFIANAKLMPSVATSFGRVFGPVGKMPSPQLGILLNEDEKTIQEAINKINLTVRIRVKEPSIKIGVGKQSLSDEQLLKNLMIVYNKIVESLSKGSENIKNVLIKYSMDKPVRVE